MTKARENDVSLALITHAHKSYKQYVDAKKLEATNEKNPVPAPYQVLIDKYKNLL